MRRSLTFVAFGLGLGALVGCGGAGGVNFFDGGGGSAGRSASAAGASSASAGAQDVVAGADSAGAATVARAGATSSAGGTSSAGAGTDGPSDTPCSPVIDITDKGNKMSPEFQTAGPVCLLIKDNIVGWGCSNFEGRTVKVNGIEVSCADLPLPDPLHGGYYFDISGGDHAYASIYWF